MFIKKTLVPLLVTLMTSPSIADPLPQWLSKAQERIDRHPVCAPLIDQLVTATKEQGTSAQTTNAANSLLVAVRNCLRENDRAAKGYEFATAPVVTIDANAHAHVTVDRGSNLFVWNRVTGRAVKITTLQHPWPPNLRRGHVSLSPDSLVVAVSNSRETRVFDVLRREQRLQARMTHATLIGSNTLVGLHPLGKAVEIWTRDSADGNYIPNSTWPIDRARDLVVSTDGRFAWTGHALVDLHSGVQQVLLDQTRARPGAFSADANTLFISDLHGTVRVFNTSTFKQLRTFVIPGAPYTPARINVSANGDHLAIVFGHTTLNLLDAASGKVVATYEDPLRIAAFTFIGNRVAIASDDGATKIIAVNGKLHAKLVSFTSGNWAVIAPTGLYDAANGGAIEELRWRAQQLNLQLDQLKESYWHPGLFAELFDGSIPTVQATLSTPPAVELHPPRNNTAQLNVLDTGGGIGDVLVLVNGKALQTEAASGVLEIPRDRVIPGQQNTLEVRAWNATNDVSSRGVKVVWQDDGAGTTNAPPRLFAVVAGVSNYSGEAIDLRFAAKDAEAFGAALALGAERLFGLDNVDIHVLTDSAVQKQTLEKIMTHARELTSRDVLLVYLSGHGVSRSDEYYYLMSGAQSLQSFNPDQSVSSAELTRWINAIPATKQVMVLDTCAAGAAQPSLLTARGLPSAQVRAIQRLKDRTGFHVLMGSAADRKSYEASFYGQGLLTYALLEGMRGEALRDAKFVDVSRLFQHVIDRVPQLASHLGGLQQPLLAAPRAASFDIGLLTLKDREHISIAKRRTVITDLSFIEAASGFDRLNLTAGIREALAKTEVDGLSPVLLLGSVVPGALQISGSYTSIGEAVNVRLTVLRDNQVVHAENVLLDAMTLNADALVQNLRADLEVAN